MNSISTTNTNYRHLLLIAADTEFPNFAAPVLKLTANNLNQYRQYLGTEHYCIFFDASAQFHADALLAVSGTLAGGGLLVIRLPNQPSPSLQRLIDTFEASGIDTTITSAEALNNKLASHACEPINSGFQSCSATPEQASALEKVEHFNSGAVILNAPRGRGKSSLLGLWIQAQHIKYKFTLCAPSKRQANRIFAMADSANFEFLAPDQLPGYEQGENEWLLIDEAASLPSHVLTDLAKHCSRLAIATTTEGYESSGRGFALRFQQTLPQHFANILTLELSTPVRWGSGDPLEEALNRCFCVYSNAAEAALSGQPNYQYIHASALPPEQLEQAFMLLTSAHYQTSPNDLRLLLDDQKQRLFLQWHNGNLTGICWVAEEGPIPEELIIPIYQGKRRPAGQLLPQSMCFHLRSQKAARLSMQRIVRIAVAPNIQQRGAGTALLQYVLDALKSSYDLIGSSFGVSEHLHHFWINNGFVPLRIGQHIDAASGMYSALYARPLANENQVGSNQASALVAELFSRFCSYFPFQFLKLNQAQQLQWLNDWVTEKQLTRPHDQQLFTEYLADFAAGYIPFELLQPILAEAITQKSLDYGLLSSSAVNTLSLVEIAAASEFHGKAALIEHLRALADIALSDGC